MTTREVKLDDEIMSLITPVDKDVQPDPEKHRKAAWTAWKIRKITGGLVVLGIIDSVLLVSMYTWIWVTDDESIWNYFDAFHIILACAAIFTGSTKDFLDIMTLTLVVLSAIGLILNAIGIWWRDEDRMNINDIGKRQRKDTLLAYECVYLVLSFLYVTLCCVILAWIGQGPIGTWYKGVDSPLVLEFYSLLREKGIVEKLILFRREEEEEGEPVPAKKPFTFDDFYTALNKEGAEEYEDEDDYLYNPNGGPGLGAVYYDDEGNRTGNPALRDALIRKIKENQPDASVSQGAAGQSYGKARRPKPRRMNPPGVSQGRAAQKRVAPAPATDSGFAL